MTVPEPLRTVLIIVCMGTILVPSFECLRMRPPAFTVMDVVHTLLPFWLFVLVWLSIDAGRARERANQEKADQHTRD